MSIAFELALMLHIAAAIAATGSLLAYPTLRRAGALPAAARLHLRLTLQPACTCGLRCRP